MRFRALIVAALILFGAGVPFHCLGHLHDGDHGECEDDCPICQQIQANSAELSPVVLASVPARGVLLGPGTEQSLPSSTQETRLPLPRAPPPA